MKFIKIIIFAKLIVFVRFSLEDKIYCCSATSYFTCPVRTCSRLAWKCGTRYDKQTSIPQRPNRTCIKTTRATPINSLWIIPSIS